MDIIINVVGQQLKTVTNLKSVVSGTQKFIRLKFNFNSDWDGLTKAVQFIQNNVPYEDTLDVNNTVYLPPQIEPGNCIVVIYGTNNNDIRATTDYLNLTINKNMIVEDAQSIQMTESVFDMIVRAVTGISITQQQFESIVHADVEDVIEYYREQGILADLTIEDGTIGREKVDAAFESTLAKADSAIQRGDANAVTYAMLDTAVQDKLDSIDSIDLTIPDGSITRAKVDANFEATLAKADSAVQYTDTDAVTKAMLTSSVQASLNLADTAMQSIADGSITKTQLTQSVQMSLDLANSAMQSIPDASIARSKVNAAFEATLAKADGAMQESVYNPNNIATDPYSYADAKAVVVEELPQSGTSGIDYYMENASGLYEHYRWIDDDYQMIGTSASTVVVSELPNDPNPDFDYILVNNGEYQYYKYINNSWAMISGGSGEVIQKSYTIDYFRHGTPATNSMTASVDNVGQHYLDLDTLIVYIGTATEEGEEPNVTTTYSWEVLETLVATPSATKDYYLQFGANSNLLQFRYVVNKFIQIGTLAYSKDEIDTMMGVVTGNVSTLASTVSELETIVGNINNMVKDVTINAAKTQLTITYMDDSTSTITLDTGIDIDSTQYDINDDHTLHFYDSAGNELENLRVVITGGGGGGGAYGGTASIGRITGANVQCVYGDDCTIQYTVVAQDAAGDPVGDGVGTLYVNNVSVLTGFTVYTGINDGATNSIDVSDYLTVGTNAIKIAVSVDVGNENNYIATKTWTVNAINMYFTWEYSDSQINTSAVTDYFTPYGALNKTIYTFIDVDPLKFNPSIVDALPDTTDPEFDPEEIADINYFVHSGNSYTHYVWDDTNDEFVEGTGYLFNVSSTTRSGVQQSLSIPMQAHGSHAVVRYMVGDVNGEEIKTAQQSHDMVFVVAGNTTPIIATSFNTAHIVQYNTIQIPIVVYNPNSTTSTVVLAEDGADVSTWTNVDRTVHYWNYSPTASGTKVLTITCGSTVKTLTIEVEPVDVDEEEVTGYDFRFKASEMATNDAVRAWSAEYTPVGSSEPQTVSMAFSPNFDWVNGGLHTETDEDGHLRQYFAVRAGTSVTFNYNLFGQDYDPKQYGKSFKFIFKAVNCRTYDANVLTCIDNASGNNGVGLVMTANEATLTTQNESLNTYYYKDTYIEFETNIHPTSEYRYLQFWMDGSHDRTILYSSDDGMQQVNPVGITVGSPNCDVYIYMMKAYPTYLTNDNELSNFIMDAPNAYAMVDRYNRNDILNASGEIDYQKLATANPDLRVICLDLNRMSTGKKDNTVAYTVRQIYNAGGESHCFTINNACVTIQGTSSVGYLESAGNVDINFKYNRTFTSDNESYTTGQISFDDGTTSTSGYSMSANSIPVDYLNVKLNVASSENANNACIADWYNIYQPWRSPARKKNPRARDTMEFKPGVIFIRDRSGDLFGDTTGYHMYGICDIGNSKKNTKVFHDTKNPIATCVEVSNNTSLPCLMSSTDYTWDEDEAVVVEAGETQKVFEFRYVTDDNLDRARTAWDRFVNFMVDNNPNLATDEPLAESVTFGPYTFRGSGSYNTSAYDSDDYNVVYLYGYGTPDEFLDGMYDAASYVTDTTDEATCYYYINYSNNCIYSSDGTDWTQGGTLTWVADQNNVLGGTTISTYAGTYTTDSFEYRIANILQHCEEYMIIDPVVYHFVFIESFLMTDNVAKNTFWSSDDLVHWEPSKNYDNDTSLGNDRHLSF